MTTVASRPPVRGAPSDSWRSLRAAHGLHLKLLQAMEQIDVFGEH